MKESEYVCYADSDSCQKIIERRKDTKDKLLNKNKMTVNRYNSRPTIFYST